MRVLNVEELNAVSGAGLWTDILDFFSNFFNDGQSTQRVEITAHSMSDAEKFAYDMGEVRKLLPDCAVTITVNPAIQTGTISASLTGEVPGLSGTAGYTAPSRSFSYICPAPGNGGGAGNQEIN